MKLSQLEQIIEVANTGTISQASANLFISQPNLSVSIKKAEKELGIVLFSRKSTGMTLTRLGAEFVNRAKEILVQVDALSESCKNDQIRVPLELQIASLGYRIVDIELAKVIQRYGENYLKINLIDSVGYKMLDLIANDTAEIGFCTVYDFTKQVMLRQMSLRKLEYFSLSSTVSGIYVGINSKVFSRNAKTVDIEKLSSLPMVSIANREFNTHTVYEQFHKISRIDFDPRNEIIVSNFGLLRNMVNMVDSFAIASYIDIPYDKPGFYPDLRFIPFDTGIITAEFGYVQKENTVRSLLANELIKNLKHTLCSSV